MTKSTSQFRFSLKSLLVIPLIVLIGLILINTQFKHSVASTKIGFGTTLNGVYGAGDAHDQLESWLESKGYKLAERPNSGSRYAHHRESWYFGVRDNVEHYIYVRSNDSYFGADVHYEARKWMFQNRQDEESATSKAVNQIASWWDKNSSILTTQFPEE